MAFSYTAPRVELADADRELDELDVDAKEQRRRDLYGDYSDVEETAEMLVATLTQLKDGLLQNVSAPDPHRNKALPSYPKRSTQTHQGFLRALSECPEYLNSDAFLLPFLRAEKFCVLPAAQRILEYWEQKIRLFPNGNDAFGPVTLDKLQECDLRILRDGGLSLLPNDQHGRVVIHANREAVHFAQNGREALERALLYLMHVAIEDVSIQRRGMVLISATRAPFKPEHFDRIAVKRFFHMLGYGPIRNVVFHSVISFFYASAAELILPSALWLMGYEVRMRLKLHRDGSDIQAIFAPYGITELPICMGGRYKQDHDAWLREREIIEREAVVSSS